MNDLRKLAETARTENWTVDEEGWVSCCDTWEAQPFIAAANPVRVLALLDALDAARELMSVLGEGGYFPSAGAPRTERLRAAIAAASPSP